MVATKTYEEQSAEYQERMAEHDRKEVIQEKRQFAWDNHELALARIEAEYNMAKAEEHQRYVIVLEEIARESNASD